MSNGRLALFFLLAAVTCDASEPPPCRALRNTRQARASVPHVRSTDPIVLAALARGMARSATFRRLVESLDASNVIVHIHRRDGGSRLSGFTQFIAATPHVRYLRITLAADDAGNATAALLAHELRHALETAEAPEVTDESSYRALYEEIGQAACGPPQWCFDTLDAVRAGARVYTELRHHRRQADAGHLTVR